MSTPLDISCPKCGSHSMIQGEEHTRRVLDELTGKTTEVAYREIACVGSPGCNYTGEYVPWRETSQGNGNASSHVMLPLTQPPPRSNMALILDAQRMVLASCESCGVAVRVAMSFEHAEYIVWCTGSVLKRVRTAQRETAMGEGEIARESYRYHHVWGEGDTWDKFFTGEVEVAAEIAETTNQT